MAVVEEVLSACDAEYQTGLRNNIVAHQNQFKNNEGRYNQLLPTHTVTPADGVKSTPDNVAKPSDEEVGWPQSIQNLAVLQSIMVHKYQHPDDYGYLIVREVVINGDRYQATEDVGGLVGSQDWQQIVPLDVEA